MILHGRLVRFRLSPEGKIALKGLFEKSTFSAFVESVDELGAWIDFGSRKRVEVSEPSVLMLLKWEYFSTAVVEGYQPERPLKKAPLGFARSHRS
jgi:hypothetical protein